MGKTVPQLTSLSAPDDGDYLLITDISDSDASKKMTYKNATSGMELQTAYNSYNAGQSVATVIPIDDTIPQSSEGTEIVTVSITPKRSDSTLYIEAGIVFYCGSKQDVAIAIFRDTTANAINASPITVSASGLMTNFIQAKVSATSTTTTTFKLRVGVDTGGSSIYVNGKTTRLMGDTPKTFIKVTEVAA